MPEQPREISQLSNLVLKMLEKVSVAKEKQGLDEKTIAIQELKSESFHELVDMLLDIKDKYPLQYISRDSSFIDSSLELGIFRLFYYVQFINDDNLNKKFIQLNGRNAYVLFYEESFKLEYIDIALETFDKSFSFFGSGNYTAEVHIAHLALFANFVSAIQDLETALKYQIVGFDHYCGSTKETEERLKRQKEINIILAEERQIVQRTTFAPEDYEPYLQKMYIKRDFWYQNLLKLESQIKTELDNYLQTKRNPC